MYPLYRSWLSAGPAHDPATLQTPPDTIIVVGDSTSSSRQFAGHRAVLTAHSGFFKGALTGRTTSPTSICVPSVFPEAFAPLLSFMYTGYLDISPDNIYAVLLATHYLHMPRALDLCWSYLRQNQLLPTTVPTPLLVKPIPSRGKLPALTWHQPSPLNTILSTAEHSPFRSVYAPSQPYLSGTDNADPIDVGGPGVLGGTGSLQSIGAPIPTYPPSRAPRPSETTPPPDAQRMLTIAPEERLTPPDGSDVDMRAPLSPLRQTSPPREVNQRCQPQSTDAVLRMDKTTSPPTRSDVPTDLPSEPNKSIQNDSTSFAPKQSSSKVVIDVACCDGPVRFHRVLNQSYGLADDAGTVECVEDIDEDAGDENQFATRRIRLPGAGQLRRARAERLAAANADPASGSAPGSASPRSRPQGSTDTQIDYTCLYCNHTFKSHYCYQKHASRHLNPVSPKAVIGHVKTSSKTPSTATVTATVTSRPRPNREAVRPLDMNVQYYPCKTCGSKFPSYYFVHKHRKMCHLSETESNYTGQNQPTSSEGSAKSTEETKSS